MTGVHWFDVRPDREHDWPVWKEMFSLFIPNQVFLTTI
jgi:esterase/lipase superfamily enzyme